MLKEVVLPKHDLAQTCFSLAFWLGVGNLRPAGWIRKRNIEYLKRHWARKGESLPKDFKRELKNH